MEEIKNYAPVIIPTLNRYVHFRRLIESLARCTHADMTEMVIGLDYPPSDKYVDGFNKINEYVDTITGFRKVTILRTDHNLGQSKNSKRCLEYVFQHYDNYIYSEDDNEMSPCFLDYMNKALIKYKDNPKVIAICGYNYPVDMTGYNKNIFAFQNYSAWGVGMWKGKESFPQDYQAYAQSILKSPRLLYKIWKKDARMLHGVINSAATGCRYGDRIWTLKCLLEDKYCIYPTISLVRNWGVDGTGQHCGKMKQNNPFAKQAIFMDSHFDLDDIEIADFRYRALMTKYMAGNLTQRIKVCYYVIRDIITIMK